MRYDFHKLLNWLWTKFFGWLYPVGRCSHCGKENKRLCGFTGPLGNRVPDVCTDCARACVSITKQARRY